MVPNTVAQSESGRERFGLGGASGLRRAPLGVEGWLADGWGSVALLHLCLHPPNASPCDVTAEAEGE